MNGTNTLGKSDEVMRLVQTVERLGAEDQERILRIVTLLTVAPPAVRHRTHQMLKSLLDSSPGTMRECIAGVDEVIEYLENNLHGPGRRMSPWEELALKAAGTRHN